MKWFIYYTNVIYKTAIVSAAVGRCVPLDTVSHVVARIMGSNEGVGRLPLSLLKKTGTN
jgi:hypothetical protein